MIILITGVAGLIGSHLSRHLLNKGYRVIGIDDFSGGYEDFLVNHSNFKFFKRCLGKDDISDIFKNEKPSVVFHLAAYAAEGLSPFIRKFNYTNNILASVCIINECIKNNCKLIFTSSMAVYGNNSPPFIESLKLNPIDPYGIAKYCVELDLQQANSQFGLKYSIIRPHNVLGIYQNIWDKYRNVIGIFIRKVLFEEDITIYGDGEQTRAFSDVKFYMDPFEKIIKNFDGEVFNIGADKYYSINEVANLVKKISNTFGFNPNIVHLESRHEVKHAYCDHEKAKTLLSFEDNTDLEKLIFSMFSWALNQPKREVKLIDYEITNKIYNYWKI